MNSPRPRSASVRPLRKRAQLGRYIDRFAQSSRSGSGALLALVVTALSSAACSDGPSFGPPDDGSNPSLGGEGNATATGGRPPVLKPTETGGTAGNGTGGAGDAVCGNGALEIGELCDDGNTEGDDGCSADCLEVDANYVCIEPGEKCERTQTCGNGVVEGVEVCDDGNTKSGDGCDKACAEIEADYICTKPGRPCVAVSVCGNGTRERGEQCDDGQEEPEDGDGCSAECQLEEGYFCPPGGACVELVCGDGNRTPDEACDDGDTSSGDGCSDACEVEEGFRCSAAGCRTICGDGLLRGSEECDDANVTSADGCSAACRVEPYQACSGEPSVCGTTIACGNEKVEPGEICDPVAADIPTTTCVLTGANACKAFDNGLVDVAECGNGKIEFGEACDGDAGSGGCSDACAVEDGFACPKANLCFRIPACGDGLVQAGEKCDVGMMTSLACDMCQVQDGWFCSVEVDGSTTCVESVCGDGTRAPDEQCDDDDTVSGDGCSATCLVESGWVCPPGVVCQPVCGDGQLAGEEQCDVSSPGCVNCRIQPGYDCGADGTTACAASVCGNGIVEHGESCDDGGLCSEDHSISCDSDADCSGDCVLVAGDGCGPTCQVEPHVTVGRDPVVATTCGDGLRTGAEGADGRCDDGNTDPGDGCDATCYEEPGWSCSDVLDLPDEVNLKVKYRDFKGRYSNVNNNTTPQPGGHPHFGKYNVSPFGGTPLLPEITGALCSPTTQAGCGRLDSDGKPELMITPATGTMMPDNPDMFYLWYRSNNGGFPDAGDGPLQWGGEDIEVLDLGNNDYLTLERQAGTRSYVFGDTTFFPLDGRGHGTTVGSGPTPTHNFHFTSEVRYFFRYERGQELRFFGDDDVWVYVNGRLAVDIGGIHGQINGRVVLGDEDASCDPRTTDACTLSQAELDSDEDARFDITVGNLYEIVVFQAERSPTDSYYQLTLNDFIAPRSFCETDCGDGEVAGNELCDEGSDNVNGEYGKCNTSCTYSFCGDGVRQTSDEACDNGLNIDTYDDGSAGLCAPGCVAPPSCGDGIIQPSEDEECDNGTAGNDGSYGGCTSTCKLAAYCGDDEVDAADGEACDTPGEFVTYGDGTLCGFDCQLAPYCGDGERNGPEHCEPGELGCNESCTFDPFCGDGLLDTGVDSTEQCDFGEFATPDGDEVPYGGCDESCQTGPSCGDGELHAYEECDDGPAGNDGEYDGCTAGCTLGPRCGDAILQSVQGEKCDNGFNDDVYAYPGMTDACGAGCSAVPYCGDNEVQSMFELCDEGSDNADDAYDGCTTTCDWGPYCGDGKKNGKEDCDDGAGNVAYSPDGKGCSYECSTDVPRCGDGIRNGSEQCDLGESENDGDYGGCNANCTRAPYCGDGVRQTSLGEECDDGPQGSFDCDSSCRDRGVK